ncbi:MAG: hypothetical protein HY452_00945 [Parcubacteria group bacterium]|nr:hypothetical protein [Parcubacteria group bacterium]
MKKIGLLITAVVLCWSSSAAAEEVPTITTVMENGPGAYRINVVFLSEAYVASQRETYFNDVAVATEGLFQFTPFKEYRNYFNVYAIWAASQDSFLSNVAWGEEPRTYFGEPGGLTSSSEKVEQTVRAFLTVGNPVVAAILVNDDRAGAGGVHSNRTRNRFIGGMSIGTGLLHHDPNITEPIYRRTVIHEFGHALGGLSDEYNGTLVLAPGQTESNFLGSRAINVTTETRREFIKWNHWVDPVVPIPTPVFLAQPTAPGGSFYLDSAYADKVGLFEGAFMFDRGWYRPKLHCMMRDSPSWEGSYPFCEVCREALVLEIYRQVDPTAEVGVAVSDTVTVFSINPPVPVDHNLQIQWLVDDSVVPNQFSNQLEVTDTGIGYGRHTVTVEVVDTTEFVRKDSEGLLVRSVRWQPVVFYPPPDFSGDGKVDFDDFFMFADVFGRAKSPITERYDLDWDGRIDFNDFFLFADAFGGRISESRISVELPQ